MKKVMKAVAALFLSVMSVIFTGCGNNNKDASDVNVILSGHGYVDLGLPSGTLWATCNVGATTPEGYGTYFAWGETRPKTVYNWSTYKWYNVDEEFNATLTKYCNDSRHGYNGFTDNLTVLLPEDDAATANWGKDCHIPTFEQWDELYQNTTITWPMRNGVYGMLFTSSNGNSIFLPAAGCQKDSGGVGIDFGGYWSSSLHDLVPKNAWYIYFNSVSTNAGGDGFCRDYGLPVRAVYGN